MFKNIYWFLILMSFINGSVPEYTYYALIIHLVDERRLLKIWSFNFVFHFKILWRNYNARQSTLLGWLRVRCVIMVHYYLLFQVCRISISRIFSHSTCQTSIKPSKIKQNHTIQRESQTNLGRGPWKVCLFSSGFSFVWVGGLGCIHLKKH